jgi:hypothetical protein
VGIWGVTLRGGRSVMGGYGEVEGSSWCFDSLFFLGIDVAL